jgi:hypothetical protein
MLGPALARSSEEGLPSRATPKQQPPKQHLLLGRVIPKLYGGLLGLEKPSLRVFVSVCLRVWYGVESKWALAVAQIQACHLAASFSKMHLRIHKHKLVELFTAYS